VKYVMVPSDIEIIDICVEDDMSKMMFYSSDGPSKFYETETDLKMKVRDRAFTDYRKYFECTFDWKKLVRPGRKISVSILEQIYENKLFTCGVLTKIGISKDKKSLV
jgi:hypothetical protein